MVDISNPYFLHHSDHPGISLVSHPLTGDNYSSWSHAMTTTLNAKNKLGFVDGSLPKPASLSSTSQVWACCNDMVKSWLISALSREISNSVMYEPLASGIWNDLIERFAQTNAPRVFELRRDIALHSQANLSISAYFTKLKSYWDELYSYLPIPPCTCGSSKALHDYQQQERLTQFLMGLHESYSNIRGQILLMDPLPSISRAYSLFLQEEKQRQVTTTSITPESAAYAATSFAPSQQRQIMTTSITPESGAYAVASFAPSRQSAGHEKSRGRRTHPTCDHCNWASTNTSHAMSSITPEQVEQHLSLLKDRTANPLAHFAAYLPRSRDKFSPRARQCIFVGYPMGQMGYRVYDLITHEFFTSRDVIFHEQIFPYRGTNFSEASQTVLPLPIADNCPSYASESTTNEPENPDLNEPPHIQSLDPPTSTHVPLDSVAQPLPRSTRSHRPPAHL
ncbi:hypothetical protein RHSIM_Rhsim07G0258800 [Rhododendron simsii]|uniref:Retrotransposon Copia-like N-terminal domain-containing protein n=1 Tax=Rhododendron simsii TaxID=118357 RepID=A0A834GRY4_RHOSS|nr:hypothetical protein RHSIM_Rhsim07G0258800 [Rhododendron simsii]